ncbi:MAG: hypothetical protein A2252_09900 [Elusimicrobia bacterium RIFOXYA2_FULL_39_19]|nr:MAG: hypothetical protein A2252_09900 [Elusimicrobia bacterium RIFOXYA2_FULL_39_19]
MENNDIELMLKVKTGDLSAFDLLLDSYEKPIINFIYRYIGSREDAEDLAQEVFLKVYRAVPYYEPRSKFSTWLFRIAHNVSIDYLRKNRNKRTLQVSQNNPDEEEKIRELYNPDEPGAETLLENKQVREKVNSLLAKLPDKQKTALILRIYDDKSYLEIAAILACSVPAVEALIFRARETLKKQFG